MLPRLEDEREDRIDSRMAGVSEHYVCPSSCGVCIVTELSGISCLPWRRRIVCLGRIATRLRMLRKRSDLCLPGALSEDHRDLQTDQGLLTVVRKSDLQTTMGCVQGSPSRRLVPQCKSGSNTGANLSEFAGEVKMRVSRARDSGWPFKSFLNSADRLTAFFSTAECTRQLSRTLHGFPSDLTTPHCLSGSIW
jgi:hypothetical protein